MGKCVYRGLSIQIVGAYPLHKKGVSLTLPLNVHKVWFAARTGTRQESAMDLLRLQGDPANRDGRTAPLNGTTERRSKRNHSAAMASFTYWCQHSLLVWYCAAL